jgi:hypothetical protein
MNTKSLQILEAAGMKNPKDRALVEAIEATLDDRMTAASPASIRSNPWPWALLGSSLAANVVLAVAVYSTRVDQARYAADLAKLDAVVSRIEGTASVTDASAKALASSMSNVGSISVATSDALKFIESHKSAEGPTVTVPEKK